MGLEKAEVMPFPVHEKYRLITHVDDSSWRSQSEYGDPWFTSEGANVVSNLGLRGTKVNDDGADPSFYKQCLLIHSQPFASATCLTCAPHPYILYEH